MMRTWQSCSNNYNRRIDSLEWFNCVIRQPNISQTAGGKLTAMTEAVGTSGPGNGRFFPNFSEVSLQPVRATLATGGELSKAQLELP